MVSKNEKLKKSLMFLKKYFMGIYDNNIFTKIKIVNNNRFISVALINFLITLIFITSFSVNIFSNPLAPMGYGSHFAVGPNGIPLKDIKIDKAGLDSVDYELRRSLPSTIIGTDSMTNYNGEKVKNGFVYHDGKIYAVHYGYPVSSTLYSPVENEKVNDEGKIEIKYNDDFVVYVNEKGHVTRLSGINKMNGKYVYFDTKNHLMLDDRSAERYFENLKKTVAFTSNNTMCFDTYVWSNKEHTKKVLIDKNGFYIEQGIYKIDDEDIYIDSDFNIKKNALYKYNDEKFWVKDFVIKKRNLSDEEVKEIEETEKLKLINDELSEWEKEKKEKYCCEVVYGDDEKKHLYNKSGKMVKADICKVFDYSLNDANIFADENGVVVEKEGLYQINRYDKDHKIVNDEDHKIVNDEVKYCFVGEDSKVVSDDFIICDGKVYYAYSSGYLAKNTFVGNRYYFNDKCELVYGDINENNIEEARNWMFYRSLCKKYNNITLLNEDGKVIDIIEAADRNIEVYHDATDMPKEYLSKYKVTTLKNGKKGIKLTDKFITSSEYVNYGDTIFDYHAGVYYIDENGKIVKDAIKKINANKYVFSEKGPLIMSSLLNYSRESENIGENVKKILHDSIAYVDGNGILIEDKCIVSRGILYGREKGYHDNDIRTTIVVINADKKYNKEPMIVKLK